MAALAAPAHHPNRLLCRYIFQRQLGDWALDFKRVADLETANVLRHCPCAQVSAELNSSRCVDVTTSSLWLRQAPLSESGRRVTCGVHFDHKIKVSRCIRL